MAIIRRSVLGLSSTDDTLEWYGRAIAEMQKRPITDPTSWRFQAAIHDYDYTPGGDPLAVVGETLPTATIRKKYWRQCQHGSWFFLPWHRMYLHFFEQMIAAEVVKLGGPANWALPYWNYSVNAASRLLPAAFRNPTLADGSKNYLYVLERDPDANAGLAFANSGDTALRPALTQGKFSTPTQGNFGGLPTAFSHSGSSAGVLEGVPHGSMHVAVGGSSGWMGAFNTAALDPIFWLHHANIDRLWEVWLQRNPTFLNPASLQWLNNISFDFYDANSLPVVMRSSNVVLTSALGYTYDDVSDPLAAVVPPAPGPLLMGAPIAPITVVPMSQALPPELVGATDRSFQIGNAPTRITVPTPEHVGARLRLAASALPMRAVVPPGIAESANPSVFLQLENLTADGRANSYDLYVNVPDGDDPTQHPDKLVRRLDLFGVVEASRSTDQHAGSGLTYTVDISDIYHTLAAEPDWDPDNIHVSLVPVRNWSGATVTVGRVSLFFG